MQDVCALTSKIVDNKDRADRYNGGKVQWSLIDFDSIESLVRVLEFGADKYSRDNWKKGQSVLSLCDCLLRHIIKFKQQAQGEYKDAESGLSHLGHVMCNAMFIEYVLKNHPELDDRLCVSLKKKD
jgi:hypothetical protein